jgi:selenide,water dikinase
MVGAGAHAATDVTGFGLAGHALGMARGSGVSLRISAASLPVYDHALALASGGVKTRGTTTNQAHYQASVRVADGIDAVHAGLIYDPQTAGGLLIAIDGDSAEQFVAALRARGVAHAAIIGEAVAADGDAILELGP